MSCRNRGTALSFVQDTKSVGTAAHPSKVVGNILVLYPTLVSIDPYGALRTQTRMSEILALTPVASASLQTGHYKMLVQDCSGRQNHPGLVSAHSPIDHLLAHTSRLHSGGGTPPHQLIMLSATSSMKPATIQNFTIPVCANFLIAQAVGTDP